MNNEDLRTTIEGYHGVANELETLLDVRKYMKRFGYNEDEDGLLTFIVNKFPQVDKAAEKADKRVEEYRQSTMKFVFLATGLGWGGGKGDPLEYLQNAIDKRTEFARKTLEFLRQLPITTGTEGAELCAEAEEILAIK